MLSGRCIITIEGKSAEYGAGDFVFIPKNHLHKAEALTDDMLLIGQRLAA
jgi:quercetin dioxygenase-like cupin family protein